jgi:hypothetical protein
MEQEKKGRQILNIGFDGEYLNIDIRVSVPRSKTTPDMIKDLLECKSKIINGQFDASGQCWLDTRLIIEDNDDISFVRTVKEFN